MQLFIWARRLAGTRSLKLMDEEMVPVLSPQLYDDVEMTPQNLTRLPLLHLETRSDDAPGTTGLIGRI